MLLTLWCLWGVVLAGVVLGIGLAVRAAPPQLLAITAIGLIAFGLRGGFSDETFFGLEYEDAYVYSVAARQFTLPHGAESDFAELAVCSVGSLQYCTWSETFPGHLPGFPALLVAAELLIGYDPFLAPTVGALASSFAALALWWAALAVYRSFAAAALAASLFATTPVFALFGGSATSESVSSLPIAVALAATAVARQSAQFKPWLAWHGLALCAVVVAATVRRENAILIGLVPLVLLIRPRIVLTAFARSGAGLAWVSAALFAAWPVVVSLQSEVGEFGEFSFGLSRLLETSTEVLGALIEPRWFGLTAIAGAVGAAVAVSSLREEQAPWDRKLLLVALTAALGMAAMYASHVRSTYQLMGVSVDQFDFLRYLSNIGVFLCLQVPAAVWFMWRGQSVGPIRSRASLAFALMWVGVSAGAAWILRIEMVAVEQRVRIEPAIAAIAASADLGDRYPILTFEPLVVQIFAGPATKVIALPFLAPDRVGEFSGRVLYLRQDQYENDVNRRRYAEALAALPKGGSTVLRSGKTWSVSLTEVGSANHTD